jgi:hypothetical protein
LELLWIDNSRDEEFHRFLQRQATKLSAPLRVEKQGIHLSRPSTHPTAVEEIHRRDIQVAMVYQSAQELVDTEWVLTLETDVLLRCDTIQRLRQALTDCSELAAVSANVPYLAHHRSDGSWLVLPMAWKFTPWLNGHPPPEPVKWHRWEHRGEDVPDGVEIVDAVPFGCLLMRASAFRGMPLSTGWPVAQTYGFDQLFCRDLREAGQLVGFHWGVPVGHLHCGRMKTKRQTEYRDLGEMVDGPMTMKAVG